MKHNPALLKESVDKSLELLVQGKLKGPHISGEFELDQVLLPVVCGGFFFKTISVRTNITSNTEALWAHLGKTARYS